MLTSVNNTDEEACTAQLLLATYADDTAMLASHSSLQIASNGVQFRLPAIKRWTSKWNITINCTKSACVHLPFTMRPQTCLGLFFEGNTIDFVSSYCYLGVHLDRTLIWKEYITAVGAKSS
uniref:HDC20041 n=1 Tax=Drosophila melanogaster TaxID=7227 RepID=Q6II19_DROME|nr:TPA_inf: HDC20041 [Drosophila melanogaster]